MPESFDLDALLAPIPGDKPAGPDLRQDYTPQSLYRQIRDLRNDARQLERRQEAASETEKVPPADPQWRDLLDLARQALSERTKDLEIAAWYTEGLLRRHGLSGFIAGCRLLTGLVKAFWDDLYPLPDEDGLAGRVAPIAGLNGIDREGTLLQPLRTLPLFRRSDQSEISLWQYEQSAEAEGFDSERREKRYAGGTIPFETVEQEARAKAADLAVLYGIAQEASAEWRNLHAALEARVGSEAPPSSRVAEVLDRIEKVAEQYAGAPEVKRDTSPPNTRGPITREAPPLPQQAATTVPAGAGLLDREAALRTLDELAAYFRRTEPNSPLAYTLQEAARRGRMTWPELLAEVVADESARHAILNNLGIKPPPAET
ncbi:MAG: type VI secretion system protein TssA [Acetobacteraceae bacterium]|nr:type VI secretion system protein TssA [Acetobacteraceae bacterium]